ncbi:tetratricopeptide repeat protein [Rhodanobacter hydrolyticus]|uniref:Tetratricopeptide repeat protein n=1 Tax=Rhodanobacter hydrolyticus TaxID=2250595 RepID=A0ABW8J9N0_9GAMM
MMQQRHQQILPVATLLLTGLLALWAYWPGLSGGFLFDDLGSLPALGAYGPVTHWDTFWRYITSGTADPTGRPLAMLTFLLDAHDWPANPLPFKRTNLILHLLNGVLLYLLLARLGKFLGIEKRRSSVAASLGCALWLLHPLMVSTTLYVVQREAMLATVCTLAGLLLWLHGRHRLCEGRLKSGMMWSVLGLGGFTLLGTLAKANGALLPLYALLIEIVLLRDRHPVRPHASRRAYRWTMAVLGLLPALALIGYLVKAGAQGLMTGGPVGIRSWSIGQRLLTEPRVLMDYLQLLWLPRPFSSGLFNDQYVASSSWLHPAITLPSTLAVCSLIAVAWWQRRWHPAFALALLFYFAGQLLESTSLPLELYFEHRNYAPALLMFWPLGLWLTDTCRLKIFKVSLVVVLPLILATITHARAEVWGDVRTQGLVWAKINPASPRAQANAAEIEMENDRPLAAINRLEVSLAAHPEQSQLVFNLIDARCMVGGVGMTDTDAARKAMQSTTSTGTLFVRWFEHALPIAISERCPGLDLATLQSFIDAGLHNPRLSAANSQQDLTWLRGRIALAEHQPDVALIEFERALDMQIRPAFALQAAATLGAAGYPPLGLQLLDHYQLVKGNITHAQVSMSMLHEWVLERQNYWQDELARLRATLQTDTTTQYPSVPAANQKHP